MDMLTFFFWGGGGGGHVWVVRAHLPMCFGMHVPTLSTAFTYTHCRSKRDTRLRSENEIALCFYKCISADFITGGEMYRAYLKTFFFFN